VARLLRQDRQDCHRFCRWQDSVLMNAAMERYSRCVPRGFEKSDFAEFMGYLCLCLDWNRRLHV